MAGDREDRLAKIKSFIQKFEETKSTSKFSFEKTDSEDFPQEDKAEDMLNFQDLDNEQDELSILDRLNDEEDDIETYDNSLMDLTDEKLDDGFSLDELGLNDDDDSQFNFESFETSLMDLDDKDTLLDSDGLLDSDIFDEKTDITLDFDDSELELDDLDYDDNSYDKTDLSSEEQNSESDFLNLDSEFNSDLKDVDDLFNIDSEESIEDIFDNSDLDEDESDIPAEITSYTYDDENILEDDDEKIDFSVYTTDALESDIEFIENESTYDDGIEEEIPEENTGEDIFAREVSDDIDNIEIKDEEKEEQEEDIKKQIVKQGDEMDYKAGLDELTSINYVDKAEQAIDSLISDYDLSKDDERKMITTSQLENFYKRADNLYTQLMNTCDKNSDDDVFSDEMVAKINDFRVMLVFEAGSDSTIKEFVKTASIFEYLKQIGNSRSKLIVFKKYMEALVAFRKYKL